MGAARDYLCELAAAGQDVYCYSPVQLEERPAHQRWKVWLMGSRRDFREWLQQFLHGTDEVY